MNENEIVEENVVKASSTIDGLYATLDSLEEELCGDVRYYALMSCLRDVIGMLNEATDALSLAPEGEPS